MSWKYVKTKESLLQLYGHLKNILCRTDIKEAFHLEIVQEGTPFLVGGFVPVFCSITFIATAGLQQFKGKSKLTF